jgi:hypothetical protein
MTNDCRFLATNIDGLNQMNSFIFEKSRIGISVPMQDTFPFKAMKETNEQHKTKIGIDEIITVPTNITLSLKRGALAPFLMHPSPLFEEYRSSGQIVQKGVFAKT